MKIIINGANGRMGKVLTECAKMRGFEISALVDVFGDANKEYPFYSSLSEVNEKADVLIDFSNHSATPDICAFVKRTGMPSVIASTGHNETELAMINELSKDHPVFRSRNMSLGVNVLIELCKNAVSALGGDCDIEIIEKHHRNKLDAPSGTALMIAEAINEALPENYGFVYDRTGRREVRPKNEIGISSIRAGGIFGEHEILISRAGETLTLKHTAENRSLFAEGALTAAEYIAKKKNGLYSMKDLLSEGV